MPRKTTMWGNPTREREIFYYSSLGKYISTTNSQFPIPHNTKTIPDNFFLEIHAKSV
jgi:hypothetical protein